MSSDAISSSTSWASSTQPEVSKAVEGTQLGAPKKNLNGTFLPFSIIYLTPSFPSTLAISCGSLTVATVPWQVARRANSEGTSMELSIWTWASTKPGMM